MYKISIFIVSLKLNINLFKVFISPLFRLLGGLYCDLRVCNKSKVNGLFNRIFKTFCLFLRNT